MERKSPKKVSKLLQSRSVIEPSAKPSFFNSLFSRKPHCVGNSCNVKPDLFENSKFMKSTMSEFKSTLKSTQTNHPHIERMMTQKIVPILPTIYPILEEPNKSSQVAGRKKHSKRKNSKK